jgi:hypothetical protein
MQDKTRIWRMTHIQNLLIIRHAKKAGQETGHWEAEVDRLVWGLYGVGYLLPLTLGMCHFS